MSTRDSSDIQEKEVAKMLSGRIVSGSGCGKFCSGDVLLEDWFIECKTSLSNKSSFSIKEEWITKMKEQAFSEGKRNSALVFRFSPDGEDYVVFSLTKFRDMLEELRNGN